MADLEKKKNSAKETRFTKKEKKSNCQKSLQVNVVKLENNSHSSTFYFLVSICSFLSPDASGSRWMEFLVTRWFMIDVARRMKFFNSETKAEHSFVSLFIFSLK